MHYFQDFKFYLDRKRVFKYINCFENSASYEEVCDAYNELLDFVQAIVKPYAAFKFDKMPDNCHIDKMIDCDHIVYCALTLGKEIGEMSAELFSSGRYLEGMLTDAMADELLFSYSNQLYTKIAEIAGRIGLGLTCRLTPGENDIHLSYNKVIVDNLLGEKDLNVGYTSGYMLSPLKSLAYIYGADKRLDIEKSDHECSRCSNYSCSIRDTNHYNLTVIDGDKQFIITGSKKLSIQKNLIQNKIFITSPCGGNGICGKCKIQLIEGDISESNWDSQLFTRNEIDNGFRLACMSYPDNDCVIKMVSNSDEYSDMVNECQSMDMPKYSSIETKKIEISSVYLKQNKSITEIINNQLGHSYEFSLPALRKLSELFNQFINISYQPCNAIQANIITKEGCIIDVRDAGSADIYGIAIDMGTTTICLSAVNLLTGEIAASISFFNSQRYYGADIISRIRYSAVNGLNTLTECVREDILNGITQLCHKSNISFDEIYNVVISGNTTMTHLLLGFYCESLAVAPFTTVTTTGLKYRFEEVFGRNLLSCEITIFPSISAFIGGDILAGMLKCDFNNQEGISMLVDIGTNGEIAIGNNNKILCLSTAAGPAFEGASITWGTGSVKGAICSVKIKNREIHYKTIGDEKPIGICGSGIIDIIAECLREGIIDQSGKFNGHEYSDGYIEIAKKEMSEVILLNQRDVRELQLAKSAIRSGIEVLLKEFQCKYDDIKIVYLSGGFGSKINIKNAADIGLIPKELENKVKISGNTSLGGGVKYLLHRDSRRTLEELTNKISYIELSSNINFNDLFIENLLF